MPVLESEEEKLQNNQLQTDNEAFPNKATTEAITNQIIALLCFSVFSVKTFLLAVQCP